MGIIPQWVKDRVEDVTHRGGRKYNTPEENALLDIAQERFSAAQTGKVDFEGRQLHAKWREYDQMFRSKQWLEWVPDNKSMPVINFTFNIVQSVLTRMTDTNPEMLVLPRRSIEDEQLAEMLTSVLSFLWYTNKMQERYLADVLSHALKYGTGIIKTIWDPTAWDNLGEVKYSVVHPLNFYPDPRGYSIDTMDYCFVQTPKPMEYFLRRWEEKGQYVVADDDWKESENLEGRDSPSEEQVATLTEYWYRDEKDNVCVMYYAGHVVLGVIGGELDDGKPVYPHNRFPFARLVDYESDKEFWGIGEIEVVATLQRLINSFEAQMIDNTRLMANAQWVVDKVRSGLTEEDAWIFSNDPGDVVFTHSGGVERLAGVPIPPHIPEHQQQLIFWLEQITGVFDVVQGRRPVGVRAASAIIALQEAASVRLRQKSRHLGDMMREMSEQAVSLVMDNYDEPRTFRIMGNTTPVTVNVREALKSQMQGQAEMAGMLPDIEQGPFEEERMFSALKEEIKFPEFDVQITVGPSIPYSQALLYEQAKEFYSLGIIDREAVLEASNFPNREKIMQRMQEQEQAAMEAAQEEARGERTGERV